MRVFIWKNLAYVSCRYHTEGGVVVIEEDLELARKAYIDEYNRVSYKKWEDDIVASNVVNTCPDLIFDIGGGGTPEAIIFPDAGCC